MRERFVRRVIIEQPALADNLLLLGKDLIDVVAAQALVLHNDFREHVFRFAERQAQRSLQQPLATRLIEVDLHLFELLHVLDNFVEQRRQVLARREREIEHRDFFFQFGGDFQNG